MREACGVGGPLVSALSSFFFYSATGGFVYITIIIGIYRYYLYVLVDNVYLLYVMTT